MPKKRQNKAVEHFLTSLLKYKEMDVKELATHISIFHKSSYAVGYNAAKRKYGSPSLTKKEKQGILPYPDE